MTIIQLKIVILLKTNNIIMYYMIKTFTKLIEKQILVVFFINLKLITSILNRYTVLDLI
jgi:hypothetical protein